MVVMEYLPHEHWCTLAEVRQKERQKYKSKVEQLVSQLHSAGFVHGDLRASNFFVPKNGDIMVKLVDFDEAGAPKEARYPLYWNTYTVTRPEGAIERAVLEVEHDNFMVKDIFDGTGEPHVSGSAKYVKMGKVT